LRFGQPGIAILYIQYKVSTLFILYNKALYYIPKIYLGRQYYKQGRPSDNCLVPLGQPEQRRQRRPLKYIFSSSGEKGKSFFHARTNRTEVNCCCIQTPVGSDREQRRKGSPEGISGIRDAHQPPPPAPRREVSPGRPSARRMYPSPVESSEDEYDSCLRRSRGRKTEGRSYSPRPRKLDERHHQEEWDRRREVSPRDREPPGLRRTVPLRPGRPRSSSREKAYTDSQRDVNEGTINVLRSMHAKLMTMQGQTCKNSGYPKFDGTLKDYPKFRRRWHTFQDLYHKATPQRELVNLFRENCLEKKVAGRLHCEETMAGCWRVLDKFLQPANAVRPGSDVRNYGN
jgi:hypothetical protein